MACIAQAHKRGYCHKDLDLEKALAIAIAMETAAKDASELKRKSVEKEMHEMSELLQMWKILS